MKKLPNFLIVGAAKSGTTSLDQYLGQHKDIFMPTPKEPKFLTYDAGIKDFSGPGDQYAESEIIKTFSEYKKLYIKSNHKMRGDSSVDLLYYFDVAIPKIKHYLGDPKIIIILRNPIERAYSSFLHLKRDLREKLSFEQALDIEQQRIEQNYEFLWHYVNVGKYSQQVKAYKENFTDVKVLLLEDLNNNPEGTVKEILHFLNVDEFEQIDVSKISNVSGIPKNNLLQKVLLNRIFKIIYQKVLKGSMIGEKGKQLKEFMLQKNLYKEKMASSIRKRLQNIFFSDIKKLEKIINKDLSNWLK